MNEIAQEVLNRADVIGAWLSGKLTTVADSATQQAIDIAMQYVAFGRAYFTTVVILSVLSLFVMWGFAIKYSKQINDTTGGALWMAPGFGSLIPVIVFFEHFKDMLMVWFAPKVWLMIQLADLVKTAK